MECHHRRHCYAPICPSQLQLRRGFRFRNYTAVASSDIVITAILSVANSDCSKSWCLHFSNNSDSATWKQHINPYLVKMTIKMSKGEGESLQECFQYFIDFVKLTKAITKEGFWVECHFKHIIEKDWLAIRFGHLFLYGLSRDRFECVLNCCWMDNVHGGKRGWIWCW